MGTLAAVKKNEVPSSEDTQQKSIPLNTRQTVVGLPVEVRTKTIRIWNPGTTTDSKKLIAILPYRDTVRTLAFSRDSKILAGGSDDGTIQVWDAGTGDRIYEFKEHIDSVQAVHFSHTRTKLASASLDGTAILWSLVGEGGKLHPPVQHDAPLYAIKFSPNGNTFATGSADKLIQLWDTGTVTHKLTLAGHKDLVANIDFSPDGSNLCTAIGN